MSLQSAKDQSDLEVIYIIMRDKQKLAVLRMVEKEREKI